MLGTGEWECSGAIILPIGQSANPASLRWAHANGMPIIVMARKNADAEVAQVVASITPLHKAESANGHDQIGPANGSSPKTATHE